jgi:hypothetical protein
VKCTLINVEVSSSYLPWSACTKNHYAQSPRHVQVYRDIVASVAGLNLASASYRFADLITDVIMILVRPGPGI